MYGGLSKATFINSSCNINVKMISENKYICPVEQRLKPPIFCHQDEYSSCSRGSHSDSGRIIPYGENPNLVADG